MDPVTMAIVAALTVGVTSGVTEVGKQVIIDAYNALKTVLKKKYGEGSDLADAIAKVEKKPESEARKGMLQEEVDAVQAHRDPEVLKVAQVLLDQVKDQRGGAQIIQNIQNVYGDYSAVAGAGGTATVHVKPPET